MKKTIEINIRRYKVCKEPVGILVDMVLEVECIRESFRRQGIAKEYVEKFSKIKMENQGILIYGGAISLVERISQSKRTWGEGLNYNLRKGEFICQEDVHLMKFHK